ncbi:hypothetical protein TWF506_008748 [Arthrobotrys conoides]|uniref:CHAT domain-containing protein n=1 Tax=Arthrobotrys conoides TaxID=74498 RepID=A0AAN8RUA1_9PEZI
MEDEQYSESRSVQEQRKLEHAEMFYEMYNLRGNRAALHRAISCMVDVVRSQHQVDVSYPTLPNHLNRLSTFYVRLFEDGGDKKYIEWAIATLEKAISTALRLSTSGSNLGRQVISEYIHSLAIYYNLRFHRLGEQEDIEMAIRLAEKILDTSRSSSNSNNLQLAHFQNNLSHLYITRFKSLGSQRDLEKSVRAAEQAVSSIANTSLEGTQVEVAYLNNLSSCYLLRYTRSLDPEDLEKASLTMQRLVAVKGPGYDGIHRCVELIHHINLSTLYQHNPDLGLSRLRYQNGWTDVDFEEFFQAAEKIIANTSKIGASRCRYLEVLVIAYIGKIESIKSHPRYPTTGNQDVPQILEKAIEAAEKAVSSTPTDSPDRPFRLSLLSLCYRLRHKSGVLGSRDRQYLGLNLKLAVYCSKEAFAMSKVSPQMRISKGIELYDLYLYCRQYHQAADTAAEVTMLLPRISPRYIHRRDHEHLLSQLRTKNISSTACSLLLQTDRSATKAFKVLEVGRGVIAGLVIKSQTDVSFLKEVNPELYEHYEGLRYRLSNISTGDNQSLLEVSGQQSNQHRLFSTERELEKTEDRIRKIPGFATFQLPLSTEQLKSLAADGPIVAFNVTNLRSDALIVTKTGFTALALKNLIFSEAERRIRNIPQISSRHPARLADNNDEMKDLLKWLWISAVKPVLEHLGYLTPHAHSSPVSSLPRVWWITSGIMGLTPLHAAGIYENTSGENAMDFVISSYISTARALDFAKAELQRQHTEPMSSRQEALLVTASDEYLDFKTEIRETRRLLRRHCNVTTLQDPSREDTLNQLRRSSIIHFACHGISVGFREKNALGLQKSPSDSYLLLKGSKNDLDNELNQKITIEDLVKVKNPRARLAYLSACSTARISNDDLISETIHIANAFQLAGYPHVIGTIWEAEDESATIIAKRFYKNLLNDDSGSEDFDVALALHQAVKKLMEDPEWKEDFIAWAPFVHIGA